MIFDLSLLFFIRSRHSSSNKTIISGDLARDIIGLGQGLKHGPSGQQYCLLNPQSLRVIRYAQHLCKYGRDSYN